MKRHTQKAEVCSQAMRTYWVYILLASKPRGTLYIGMTNSLLVRVQMHRDGDGSRFTSRYGVRLLVYYEAFGLVEEAIQREKSLKRYLRQWKINLIERENPNWVDLFPVLLALPENNSFGASGKLGHRGKPDDDT